MKSSLAFILTLALPTGPVETIETIRRMGEQLPHYLPVYRWSTEDVQYNGKTCTKLIMEYKGNREGDRNGDRWLAASCVQYDLADLPWDVRIKTYSVLDYHGRTLCGTHSLDGIPDIVVEGPLSLGEGYALNKGEFRILQDTLYGRRLRCAIKEDQDFFVEAVKSIGRD